MDEGGISEGREWRIGHAIRMLHTTFKQKFMKFGMDERLDEVTLMHGWIMGYLHCNEDRSIYQKTIESEFNIRRSTVTNILQLMEKKGYISREAVDGDARLKRIVLTPKGRETAIRTREMIDKMEACLAEDIEPQELENFYRVVDKIKANLDKL
ncbi:MAG: MarR family transcriptional regulator [Roseburia sp.]|nr:MarR family transcriptional regulator [Roseburia sp.]